MTPLSTQYENLRKQATAMKGKYENKIRELQEKLASAPSTATSDVVAEVLLLKSSRNFSELGYPRTINIIFLS